MSQEQVTVEVPEQETPAAPAKTEAMTEAEATKQGLSAAEIKAGKEHGLIIEDKPAKKADKPTKDDKDWDGSEDEEDAEGADEGEESEDAEDAEDKTPEDAADEDLDPEEEAKLIKGYNPNEKRLYWEAKKERLKRQGAQRESEHTKIKLAAAEREIAALKKGAKKPDAEGDEDKEGAEGEEDEERVMTVGEFKKMMKEQNAANAQRNKEAQATIVRLEQQEAEFKTDHPDFDEVAELAKEMMDKNPRYAKMMVASAADPNENTAEFVYNLGQLHPKYKKGGKAKAAEQEEEADPKGKQKVDKAIKNAEKRQSSATVAGGGAKKIVSEDDLTLEEAARLPAASYARLSQKTRDRLLKESCA